MIDPEQQKKSTRKPTIGNVRPRLEIRIWRTQPKLDLLESAIGQLCEREPHWHDLAVLIAREANLDRLLKVLESFDETASSRQKEMFE